VDLRFDRVGVRLAFGEAFDAVLSVHARRDRLDTAIIEMAVTSPFPPVVDRMCCLRGIGTLTGFGLAVEIGDRGRFTGCTTPISGWCRRRPPAGPARLGRDHQDR
jgi:transposase